jgi:hypothetical protein
MFHVSTFPCFTYPRVHVSAFAWFHVSMLGMDDLSDVELSDVECQVSRFHARDGEQIHTHIYIYILTDAHVAMFPYTLPCFHIQVCTCPCFHTRCHVSIVFESEQVEDLEFTPAAAQDGLPHGSRYDSLFPYAAQAGYSIDNSFDIVFSHMCLPIVVESAFSTTLSQAVRSMIDDLSDIESQDGLDCLSDIGSESDNQRNFMDDLDAPMVESRRGDHLRTTPQATGTHASEEMTRRFSALAQVGSGSGVFSKVRPCLVPLAHLFHINRVRRGGQ